MKKALISAPSLARLDISKSFYLHVSEAHVLGTTQALGPWKKPAAHLLPVGNICLLASLWVVVSTAKLVKS